MTDTEDVHVEVEGKDEPNASGSDLKDAKARVLEAVEKRKWAAAAGLVDAHSPPEAAELLHELSSLERMEVFRAMVHVNGTVFTALRPSEHSVLIPEMAEDSLEAIFEELPSDTRISIIEGLAEGAVTRVVPLLRPDELELVRPLLGCRDGTVGRIMHVLAAALLVRDSASATEAAADLVRRRESGKGEPAVILVVSDQRVLRGHLRAAALADPALHDPDSEPVEVTSLMEPPELVTLTDQSIRAFLDEVQRIGRDLGATPVVDEYRVVVGLVTMFDAVHQTRLLANQATQSTLRLLDSEAATPSYSKQSPSQLAHKRIIWLLFLLIINFGAAGVLRGFEKTLASHIALTYFVPLLAAVGGNTGTQVATLLIAALSSRDVSPRDAVAVLGKEVQVGTLLCLPITLVTWAVSWAVSGDIRVGIVVAITMILNMNIANVLGTGLPFACARFNVDPSVMAGPLLTSIMDIAGILIYLVVATIILGV